MDIKRGNNSDIKIFGLSFFCVSITHIDVNICLKFQSSPLSRKKVICKCKLIFERKRGNNADREIVGLSPFCVSLSVCHATKATQKGLSQVPQSPGKDRMWVSTEVQHRFSIESYHSKGNYVPESLLSASKENCYVIAWTILDWYLYI